MAEKGVDITWEDFSIVRPLSRSEIRIRKKSNSSLEPSVVLNPSSGTILKGTFTTILGPSGCGKTTFINFLSNRLFFLRGLKYKGSVYINGHSRESLDYNSVAGYVMQEEVLLEHLTVRETLEFSASFKMHKSKIKSKTDEVITQLGLKSCEYSYIGGFLRKGISGGEKKRTSIGVELLTEPSILFLDEPTTGLDSFTAESLVQLLNDLAGTGVTVIATIHQPNSYIFALFDRIMLFGGQELVFHGKATESLNHFSQLGFVCPPLNNPAEYLLELVTQTDENFQSNMERLKTGIKTVDLDIEEKPLPEWFKREFSGFFKSVGLLISRSAVNTTRNYTTFLYKSLANICFLLLVLAAYYKACDSRTVTSITDRGGIIFIILVYLSFLAASGTTSLSSDKGVYIREQTSRMYSPTAFYLSKLLFDIPFDQILVFIMGFLLYLAIGLRLDTPDHIFFFVMVLLLLDLTTRGWGNFLLISLPNPEAASAATPFIIILQLLFAGLFINYDNIPNYLIWLEYASMFKYSWSATMYNELEGHNTTYWEGCGGCPGNNNQSCSQLCDPFSFYSLDIIKWYNVLILGCIAIIVHFLAFLSLNLTSRKYRIG